MSELKKCRYCDNFSKFEICYLDECKDKWLEEFGKPYLFKVGYEK